MVMHQGRTHYNLVQILIRRQIQELFFTRLDILYNIFTNFSGNKTWLLIKTSHNQGTDIHECVQF